MRLVVLCLGFLLWALPAAAAEDRAPEMTPWPAALEEVVAPDIATMDAAAEEVAAGCCKVCQKGKPCGNSCIARDRTCHQPPGCACAVDGPPAAETDSAD